MIKLKLYSLNLREVMNQGVLTTLFWIGKKIFRLGHYGHCALVVDKTEYSLTIDGIVSYDEDEANHFTHDYLLLDVDEYVVLTQIVRFGDIVGNKVRVTLPSLLRALSRPNCYHEHACCTHFVSYCLSIPPTTFVDELCQTILSSDTSHVPVVVPKTTSESGSLQRVGKNAIASVARRQSELNLIRKLDGLYAATAMALSNGERLRRKLVSNMMFLSQDKS